MWRDLYKLKFNTYLVSYNKRAISLHSSIWSNLKYIALAAATVVVKLGKQITLELAMAPKRHDHITVSVFSQKHIN